MRLAVNSLAITTLAITALTISLAAVGAANAAPSVSADDAPMQVTIVRANWPGCEPDCPEWIAARGRIDETTPSKFRKVLAQIGKRKLPVLIDSLGGSGLDGYTVGRMIRAKGLDVSVTQTELKTCAKDDKTCTKTTATGVPLGRPKTLGSKCASACVHILAGGSRRFAGLGTFVGVHQVKSYETRIKVLRTYRAYGNEKVLVSEKRMSSKTVPVETTSDVYSKMGRFFVEMGVRDSIMPLVMSAPHTKIHLMTLAELKMTNLVTGNIDGELIVMGTATPPLPPTAATPGTGGTELAKPPSSSAAAASVGGPNAPLSPVCIQMGFKCAHDAGQPATPLTGPALKATGVTTSGSPIDQSPKATANPKASPKAVSKSVSRPVVKTGPRPGTKRPPARFAAPGRGPMEQPF